uniref:(California timema) hypothetical protein n=1 Tax=Timema californicum TaxID=61474 RepID=A0A7R9J716_TIMCA|nr:unnamed protein product [Timema californicum]
MIFRKTCLVAGIIYGFRDTSVLVSAEGYFGTTLPNPSTSQRAQRGKRGKLGPQKRCVKRSTGSSSSSEYEDDHLSFVETDDVDSENDKDSQCFVCDNGNDRFAFRALPKGNCSTCTPIDPAQDIVFLLYTRRNPDLPFQLKLNEDDLLSLSPFDHEHPTVFYIHGFTELGLGLGCNTIKEERARGEASLVSSLADRLEMSVSRQVAGSSETPFHFPKLLLLRRMCRTPSPSPVVMGFPGVATPYVVMFFFPVTHTSRQFGGVDKTTTRWLTLISKRSAREDTNDASPRARSAPSQLFSSRTKRMLTSEAAQRFGPHANKKNSNSSSQS